jgi:hypothetical protein
MVEGLKPGEGGVTERGRLARLLGDPPRAAVLLACAAVLGLRRAEAWSNPQFWAEDSRFYQSAVTDGLRAFLEPMGGYICLFQRAVAAIAAHMDPALAPALFVGAATATTLYVAALALAPRCPLPRTAGLCALAVVLVPETHEVLLNLVNLQWVLGAGLILVLISADPEGPAPWAHDALAAAVTGLTGPFCILLAPLFFLRAAVRRTGSSAALAAVVAGCALIQAAMLHGAPPSPFDPPGSYISYRFLLPIIGRRIGGSLLMGSLLGADTDELVGSLVGLLTLAGVAYLAFRPGAARAARAVLGLAFAVMVAAALYRCRHGLYLFFTPETRARYLYVPQLLALWLLIAAAVGRGRTARICALLCAWGFAVNVPRLRERALVDLHWPLYAERIRAGEAVAVPTNPAGWSLRLPARDK